MMGDHWVERVEHTWLYGNTGGKGKNVRNTLSDPPSDAIVIVTAGSVLLSRLGIVSLMI